MSDEPEAPTPREIERERKREAIRKTVERVAPLQEIDTTKVLTDEEMEALREQTAKRLADKELAEEIGRDGLMRRLKQAVKKTDACAPPSRVLDPEKLREKLAE